MDPRSISIDDLDYDLPVDRIAQQPLADRDASRLLQYKGGAISDHNFTELPDLLPQGTLLVLNDTRVVNARLFFQRSSGATIEIFCLEPIDPPSIEKAFAAKGSSSWKCLLGNARKWREGEMLRSGSGSIELLAERIGKDEVGFRWSDDLTFGEMLDRRGHVPLPPYMQRPDAIGDRERYNTVFARSKGSVAAPTASLHFSDRIMQRLKEKRIATTTLTLHVGAGTFLPVKSDRMEGHTMHSEQVRIPMSTIELLADRSENEPIVPVGTTALRSLESLYWHGVKVLAGEKGEEMAIGQWEPYDRKGALPSRSEALRAIVQSMPGSDQLTGSTRLLIAPGYQFRFVDGLITNFHQPKSTLLLLVAALIGNDWRTVYDHALANGYRFLSYGDGSLLW